MLISDAWTGPIRLRLPFQTQKLVTCKPCQSAGATEALPASAGVLFQSPEVTVSENRGGAKHPRDSDGQCDRVTSVCKPWQFNGCKEKGRATEPMDADGKD